LLQVFWFLVLSYMYLQSASSATVFTTWQSHTRVLNKAFSGLPRGRQGHFLEPHNTSTDKSSIIAVTESCYKAWTLWVKLKRSTLILFLMIKNSLGFLNSEYVCGSIRRHLQRKQPLNVIWIGKHWLQILVAKFTLSQEPLSILGFIVDYSVDCHISLAISTWKKVDTHLKACNNVHTVR